VVRVAGNIGRQGSGFRLVEGQVREQAEVEIDVGRRTSGTPHRIRDRNRRFTASERCHDEHPEQRRGGPTRASTGPHAPERPARNALS
jgi:hypothetical protein